ncbi:MAG: 2OG-Fe(II) oxygenase [Actinobacteria bacterium]|nr:MAG: 2OG-Fe(II) oxygenase [Actinomycetota bacterium]
MPVIDLSGLGTSAGADAQIGLDVVQAYGEVGFGYVVNHGISPDLVASVFELSRRFHGQPLERKLAIELNSQHRGYIPFKTSTDVNSSLEKVTKPNQSESFMMMNELGNDHPDVLAGAYLAGSNQWPEGIPDFKETLIEYHDAMSRLARSIIDVIAKSLGDDGLLSSSFDSPTTWLRLLHYPPQTPLAPADEYGSAPHRDFGAITLLAQDDVGGLSVRTAGETWAEVPAMAGSFVMNVGDMLSRWSNGRLLSTPHRVTNRSGRERYSVPFFFDPHVSTVIEPLPSCLAPGELPASPPLVFGEFLRSELESAYLKHQPTG